MENVCFSGEMFFSGSPDVLTFREFKILDAMNVVRFNFSCDSKKSGHYGHAGIATRQQGMTFKTELFDPYEFYTAGEVQLQFKPNEWMYLKNDTGWPYVFVKGLWIEGTEKRKSTWAIHGLLKGDGYPDSKGASHGADWG